MDGGTEGRRDWPTDGRTGERADAHMRSRMPVLDSVRVTERRTNGRTYGTQTRGNMEGTDGRTDACQTGG